MTVLRCTQKLLAEIRIKPDPAVGPEESGWHANLLCTDRRKCVIFTHDDTLFSFVQCGLTRPDFDHLADVFGQGLFKSLLRSGFDQGGVEHMLDTIREIRFATTNNRGILGSMNEMAQMLDWTIHSQGGVASADLADLERVLNETPFKAIGYDLPVERLRKLLRKPAHPI